MSSIGFGAGGGGFFGNLTPQDRSQIISSMLQGVAGNAMQSGSPLLAAVTPILSAMIGGRAQGRANQWQQDQMGPIGDELLGDNPQARRLADILGRTDLPDPYRRIAQQRLDAMLSAGRGRSGGGAARPPRNSALSQFVDEETGVQMIVTRDGRAVPVVGPDGQPVRRQEPRAPAAPAVAAPAVDPITDAMTAPAPRVMTEIPPVSPLAAPSLEEYANPNDPLGLRNRPLP